MQMLLEDFNAKLGREFVLKSTIWNESLCENSSDNGVRIVSSATSKNLVKSTMFLHWIIYKYTWTCHGGKIYNQTDHILVDTRWHLSIPGVHSFREADRYWSLSGGIRS